jgi:hypothetical protein
VTHELFRIREDPGEYNNLAQKHPERVQSMSQAILRWGRLIYDCEPVRWLGGVCMP